MEKRNDKMYELFRAMPEDKLPASFRERLMQEVAKEAEIQQRRSDRRGIWIASITSLLLVSLVLVFFVCFKMPGFRIPGFNMGEIAFYFSIGCSALGLLGLDYLVRHKLEKKAALSNKSKNQE